MKIMIIRKSREKVRGFNSELSTSSSSSSSLSSPSSTSLLVVSLLAIYWLTPLAKPPSLSLSLYSLSHSPLSLSLSLRPHIFSLHLPSEHSGPGQVRNPKALPVCLSVTSLSVVVEAQIYSCIQAMLLWSDSGCRTPTRKPDPSLDPGRLRPSPPQCSLPPGPSGPASVPSSPARPMLATPARCLCLPGRASPATSPISRQAGLGRSLSLSLLLPSPMVRRRATNQLRHSRHLRQRIRIRINLWRRGEIPMEERQRARVLELIVEQRLALTNRHHLLEGLQGMGRLWMWWPSPL